MLGQLLLHEFRQSERFEEILNEESIVVLQVSTKFVQAMTFQLVSIPKLSTNNFEINRDTREYIDKRKLTIEVMVVPSLGS